METKWVKWAFWEPNSCTYLHLRANFNLGKVNKSVFDVKCKKQDGNITDATQLDTPKM